MISLGANLGDRLEALQAALARLRAHPAISNLTASTCYETAPIGGPAGQQGFLNAAARFETSLAPLELLRLLHQIESEQGRLRSQRWAERTLDLDLLLYGEKIIESADLVVPHPRMIYRRFVLEPAVEVAGDWLHGPTAMNLRHLLERIERRPTYIAIAGPPGSTAGKLANRVAASTQHQITLVSDLASTESRIAQQVFGSQMDSRKWFHDRMEELRETFQSQSPNENHVVVSDFWIGQLAVDMVTENSFDALEAGFLRWFKERFDSRRDDLEDLAIQPTLLVWLKPRHDASGVEDESWRQGPPVPFPPTIIIDEDNPLWAVTEITAAIAAINDRPRKLPASDSAMPPGDKS